MKLLLVDDQPSDRLVLRKVLRELPDLEITETGSLDGAHRAIEGGAFDAAIIDLRLGDDLRNRDGHMLIRALRGSPTVAIVWTAMREVEEIREAMRNGAYDYIFKDAPHRELVARVIEGLRTRRSLEKEVLSHRARKSFDQPLVHGMVGDSAAIQRVREEIQAIAVSSDKPALIMGESGTGKELVARGLHALGPHPEAPFIAKNCSSIMETLFESEIFGHEDHAFNGARRRAGALGATGKGTLFLDEIGDMPLSQQPKLLRAIESRRYTSLGADTERAFFGRIVAATHVDLEERVRKGAFRRDLFMRLSFFPIRVPPLRDRTEDIPAIFEHYIKSNGLRPMKLTAEAAANLRSREWEGNVRQLQQLIERLNIRPPEDGLVRPQHVDAALSSAPPGTTALFRTVARLLLDRFGPPNASLPEDRRAERVDIADEMTAVLFAEALARCDQKKAPAARLLGTHRRVIERLLKRESGTAAGGLTPPLDDDGDDAVDEA